MLRALAWIVLSCFAACSVPVPEPPPKPKFEAERAEFEAALQREEWGKACDLAAKAIQSARGSEDARLLAFSVGHALCKAGRLDEARRHFLQLAEQHNDPDALWEVARLIEQAGDATIVRKELSARFDKEGLAAGTQVTILNSLLGCLDGTSTTASGLSGAANWLLQQDRPDAATESCLLAGDAHLLLKKDPAGALEIYKLATSLAKNDTHRSIGELRQVGLLMDAGKWTAAQRRLAKVEKRYHAQPRSKYAEAQSRIAAGLDAQRLQGVAELVPPPAGLTFRSALAAIESIGADADRSEAGTVNYQGRFWKIRVPESDANMIRFFTDHDLPVVNSVQEILVQQYAVTMAEYWDGVHQRYVVPVGVETGESFGLRAILHANGDIFFGAYLFAGYGLYLSPKRPTHFGPCRFGMPVERAQTIVEVLSSSELAGGLRSLRVRTADGGTFHGKGYQEGNRLIPTGLGVVDYGELGVFVGKWKDGLVDEGMFRRGDDDGGGEVIDGGRTTGFSGPRPLAGRLREYLGELSLAAPWNRLIREDESIGYFDGGSGMEVSFGRDSGYSRVWFNAARIAETDRWKLQKASDDRQRRDQEARNQEVRDRVAQAQAEWRREHPNWQEEEAAAQRAEEEANRRALEPAPEAVGCYRCGGSGQIYVPGSVMQNQVGWQPDPLNSNSGQWVVGTARTTAHMETCSRCAGTGRR